MKGEKRRAKSEKVMQKEKKRKPRLALPSKTQTHNRPKRKHKTHQTQTAQSHCQYSLLLSRTPRGWPGGGCLRIVGIGASWPRAVK